jgi:hypothetical protein
MMGSGTNRTIPLSSSCPLRTQSTYRMTMSVVHCSRSSPRVTRSSSFKMQSTNLNRSKPPSLFICSLTKTAAPVTKLVGRQRTTVVSRLRCARRYQIIASGDRRVRRRAIFARSSICILARFIPRFRSRCGRTGLAQNPQRQRRPDRADEGRCLCGSHDRLATSTGC